MTFMANFIGQSLPFPSIPNEEVILSYVKAMVIPYGLVVEGLVGCRTSVQNEIASLGLNPQGTFYLYSVGLYKDLRLNF